jgi:hypothetical protein
MQQSPGDFPDTRAYAQSALLTQLITQRPWASPDFVDTDQGFTGVSVRAAMNACS